MFWLGRYAERAEALVRLLRVVSDRRADFPDGVNPAGTACLRSLLGALATVSGTHPGFQPDGADLGGELLALLTDTTRAGGLAFAVHRMRDAAYPVRDQLSGDTWLVLGALERELLDPAAGAALTSGTLSRVLTSLLALAGQAAEGMVRDQGWRFLDAGRRLERALQVCALLRATVTVSHDTATDSLLLESLLTAAESIITYRRRYRSHAQLATVLDLLLLDPENPRSVGYQVDRLGEDVAAVARRDGTTRLTEPERLLLETATALRLTDPAPLAEADAGGGRPGAAEFLDRVTGLLERAGEALDAEHFTHLLPQQPMPTPADAGTATHLRLV
jgi:uncharacterized alpha-E superfamily protein